MLVNPLFPTVDNTVVWVLKEESRWISILMLGNYVDERLTLEVFLRYGSYCSLFPRKNCSLGKFYSLLVVDWSVAGL